MTVNLSSKKKSVLIEILEDIVATSISDESQCGIPSVLREHRLISDEQFKELTGCDYEEGKAL